MPVLLVDLHISVEVNTAMARQIFYQEKQVVRHLPMLEQPLSSLGTLRPLNKFGQLIDVHVKVLFSFLHKKRKIYLSVIHEIFQHSGKCLCSKTFAYDYLTTAQPSISKNPQIRCNFSFINALYEQPRSEQQI